LLNLIGLVVIIQTSHVRDWQQTEEHRYRLQATNHIMTFIEKLMVRSAQYYPTTVTENLVRDLPLHVISPIYYSKQSKFRMVLYVPDSCDESAQFVE